MNILEITCPAKTLIVGDYAALDGGDAIVLNTAPRFSCKIKKSQGEKTNFNIHPDSPAGQWITKTPSYLSRCGAFMA